ncbi:hypothetical protein [Helicobacter canis]|uniref:Uncharacterized protein n=1 Tax=Helicobacter canis TaxID=29419 RepID=A0A377J4L7_9HELI|nr:hypothetical protein [Helicobacter canis]STO97432.1 Uncharacterised protein [Helicobacter canis]
MKKIMLVDKVTEIRINEENPSTKAIISNNGEFDIVASYEQLDGYYVKPFRGNAKGKLVPMAQYIALQGGEFIKPLVPSELYENVYFEAESFGQQYWEEYEAIVKQFILKLGNGSSWKVCYSKEEFESYKKEQKTRAEIDGRYKVVGGEVKVDSSDKQSQESAKSHSKEVNMASFQPKCSVDEIERWLEQEKINVEAPPNQLQIIIKEFLERGCLQYRYEEKESISISISATQTSMFNMQLKLNTLPLSLQASLERSIQEASTQSTKTEVYLCIECKHDGIEK